MRRIVAFAALGAALFASAAVAQTSAPTAPIQPAAATQRTFEADYSISLGVMGTVGEAKLRINTNGPNYAARFTRQATGVARWAVGNAQDYTQTARGQFGQAGLRPSTYERKGGRRGRVVTVNFAGSDVTTVANPALGSMGNPPATRAQRLEAIDDLSALVAMVFDPAIGADPCARTIKIFDGRQRFDFAFRANGEVRVNTNGYRGQAKRCSVTYRPIAGFTEAVEVGGPMSFVFAPLAPGVWAPVRIESITDDGGVAVLDAKRVALR